MTFQTGARPKERRSKTVRLICLKPLGEGWSVQLDEGAQDMVFRSGLEAEAAAKRVGQQLASAGHPAEIRIFVRGGDLAGRLVCSPAGSSLCSRQTSVDFGVTATQRA
jgi:hypothetical protein